MIGFEGGGRRTTTRLLDGEFPKYRALLPDSFNSIAEVNKAEFIEAVKRVSLVAERNTPLRLAFGEGQAVLEAGTATRPRPWRCWRPHWRATTSRSPSTPASCWTA